MSYLESLTALIFALMEHGFSLDAACELAEKAHR